MNDCTTPHLDFIWCFILKWGKIPQLLKLGIIYDIVNNLCAAAQQTPSRLAYNKNIICSFIIVEPGDLEAITVT